MSEEISVKGIVLYSAPQSEYAKRVILMTDKLGKITAFANGAAKTGSKLIGMLRPMTACEFTLISGKNAYTIRSVRLIDSFFELTKDLQASLYAQYFLELAGYYAQDGMEEQEAKSILNLLFVSFCAMRENKLSKSLIRAVFELRIMVIEGEYYELEEAENAAETAERTTLHKLWQYAVSSPLSRLFSETAYKNTDKESLDSFINEVRRMLKHLELHKFNAASMLDDFS